MKSDLKIEIDGKAVSLEDYLFPIPYPSTDYEEQARFQEKVRNFLRPRPRKGRDGPPPDPTPIYMLAPDAGFPLHRGTAFVEAGHVTSFECPALPSPLFCLNRTVEMWPKPMRVKLYLKRDRDREVVWGCVAEGAKFVVNFVDEAWIRTVYDGPILVLVPVPAKPSCVTCPPGKNAVCNEEGQCLATGEEMPESSFGREATAKEGEAMTFKKGEKMADRYGPVKFEVPNRRYVRSFMLFYLEPDGDGRSRLKTAAIMRPVDLIDFQAKLSNGQIKMPEGMSLTVQLFGQSADLVADDKEPPVRFTPGQFEGGPIEMQGDPENVKSFLKGAAEAAGLLDEAPMLQCTKHGTKFAPREEGVTIGECPWCLVEQRDALAADYKSLKAELATIFGPVQPHHGMTWNASMLCRIGEVLAEQERPFQIRFDGPPGPEAGRFIEVEDRDGKSISKGRWEQDGEYWLLIIE